MSVDLELATLDEIVAELERRSRALVVGLALKHAKPGEPDVVVRLRAKVGDGLMLAGLADLCSAQAIAEVRARCVNPD